MNGTNKATVGVVFGIALVYAALSLVLTLMGIFDDGTVSLYLFAPHGGELGIDLAEVAGISYIVDAYVEFVDYIAADETMKLIVVLVGFLFSFLGMMTPWSLRTKGDTNPAEYLWTQRPGATVRGLGAAWGLIGTCWTRFKPLVIVPIVLLPFYFVWSLMITVFMIIPFVLVKWVIGGRIRKAKRKEIAVTSHAVCPKCKRKFDSPKVRCRCGLILDYPVPNQYGYKVHTCNNGHPLQCVRGMRSDLVTVCPYCDAEIDTREAHPVTISLVGATGSGKTTLMLASVGVITQVARTRDIAVDAATPGVGKPAVAAKDFAARTASGELDSECLFLRSMEMSDREIIFNDISGSEFEPKDNKVLFQEYYRYTDGILFTFDPISLGYGGRGATPMEVFESFHSMFSHINGFGPSVVSDIPFAVVATKNDAMAHPLSSADVRRYLIENGQDGFVRVLESVFSDVRYFAASSVGEDCKSAAAPVWWIVGKSDQELASKVPVLSV